MIGFAPYSAFIGASIKHALYSIRSPLSSAHYSAHIDAHLLVLLNLCLFFILVDSIIRTDAQYAVPRGTLLKPLVHVPNFRRLVSSDLARVTTGSTHDLLDMVSQFLTSYYTS